MLIKFLGIPFFIILKQLTVEGYCTSQTGATKGLAYDYIPRTFASCIPLTKNQRSWATK
ncbi:gluconate 2-dehydrogenase subunit 3 family protein [Pedobacter sp. NJ-S-72]